jgi:Lon-like protease
VSRRRGAKGCAGSAPSPGASPGGGPEPGATLFDVTRRGTTLVVTTVLALLLAVVGSRLPVPYVALGPGPATDTLGEVGGEPLISIEGRETFETTGELNLMTVAVGSRRVHLADAVRGWLDERIAVVPRETYFPPDRSQEEVEAENAAAFTSSQVNATAAALRQLDVPFEAVTGVGSVSPGAPADGVLEAGDVLLSVDGEPVGDLQSVADAVRDREPGDDVTLEIRRDDEEREVTLTTAAAEDGRPVIGVVPGIVELDYDFSISISLDEVGGPSAGLMFALGIIDKLTPGALADGRTVAGTGAIDANGLVTPVGGVRQKLVAADDLDADVFLVPAANCAEAVSGAPEDLVLVRVETLPDAVDALEALADGVEPTLCGA